MNLFLWMMLIIHLLIWIFFVYPFADKQIIDVPVLPNNKDSQFGLQLWDDDLYSHVYIEEIKDKSTVNKAFNKFTLLEPKDSLY